MKVKHVEHMGAFGFDRPFPVPHLPEFVFIGRSNVGKSSLINRLVGRQNIARTSNTPGKTRCAHFYPVNGAVSFVDMPGYGYAAVSREERSRWDRFISAYLAKRESLRGVIHLLDIRHSPSKEDRRVSAHLQESERPVCLVFNKIDKVKRGEVERLIGSHLGALTATPDTAVVPFSTETGTGKRALWAWIEDRLSA